MTPAGPFCLYPAQMRRPAATAAIALLLVLAGCGSDPEPTAPVASTTTPATTATSDAVDQYGGRACLLVTEAVEGGTLMQAGVVEAIAADGAKSTTPAVVSRAAALAEKYEVALDATGEDEAIAELDLAGTAREMQAACAVANLD